MCFPCTSSPWHEKCIKYSNSISTVQITEYASSDHRTAPPPKKPKMLRYDSYKFSLHTSKQRSVGLCWGSQCMICSVPLQCYDIYLALNGSNAAPPCLQQQCVLDFKETEQTEPLCSQFTVSTSSIISSETVERRGEHQRLLLHHSVKKFSTQFKNKYGSLQVFR